MHRRSFNEVELVAGYVAGISVPEPGNNSLTTVKYALEVHYAPPDNFTGLDTLLGTWCDTSGHRTTNQLEILVVPGSFQIGIPAAASPVTPEGTPLPVTGAQGTGAVVLEASVDLIDWQPILTNAPQNGTAPFVDPAAVTLPRRFYRSYQKQVTD